MTQEAFHMRCQRWFLGIRWFEQDYNTTVQSTTDLTTIGFLLQNHPLSLFIHVARLSPDVPANQILEFKCTMETSSHHILPGSDRTVAQEKHGWTKLNCLLTHYQFLWSDAINIGHGATQRPQLVV